MILMQHGVPGRWIGEGMRGGSKLVSAASCVGGDFFPFSFAALSIYFHFAFISLSIGFLLTFFPGVLWGVRELDGLYDTGDCCSAWRGRGADSQAGMPVRPGGEAGSAVGRFGGCAWADSAAALPEAAQAAEGHLIYGDRFREGSMRRHRDYLVSALVFSVSLMSK